MNILENNLGEGYHVSISRLKNLTGDFYNPMSFFDTSTGEPGRAAIRGLLVEEMLQGKDPKSSEDYLVLTEEDAKVKMPSNSAIVDIFNELIGVYGYNLFSDILEKDLEHVAKKYEYGSNNWKIETIINKLSVYEPYYNLLARTRKSDKQIIDNDLYQEASSLYSKAFLSDYWREFFNDPNIEWQKELQFTHMGVDCKGFADVVKFNHREKTIELYDIKTTELNPGKAARRGRWDMQLAFYKKGLEKMYPEYKVIKASIILLSHYYSHPIQLNLTNGAEAIATYGTNDTYVEGYEQLLAKYRFHKETNMWTIPYNVYSKGDFLQGDLNLWTI